MCIGALATVVTVFDVLLGVVPCSTSVAEVVSHELTSEDDACKERTKCCVTDTETNNYWRKYCQQCWGGELTQRCCGADVDDWAVVRLLGAGHDAAVFELAAYFLHNYARSAAYRTNGECREHHCNRTTNE
ncbi:unannotated protein [freshwater metagenome]|uniref:Unannotated protein n=1 Tax=freshwater metagenome TaxID=449393 RepID=A0A6J6L6R4_9ZZZZ